MSSFEAGDLVITCALLFSKTDNLVFGKNKTDSLLMRKTTVNYLVFEILYIENIEQDNV